MRNEIVSVLRFSPGAEDRARAAAAAGNGENWVRGFGLGAENGATEGADEQCEG